MAYIRLWNSFVHLLWYNHRMILS